MSSNVVPFPSFKTYLFLSEEEIMCCIHTAEPMSPKELDDLVEEYQLLKIEVCQFERLIEIRPCRRKS
ncbi:hypothetical protein [Peribacillus sp. YIM B13477]|uniref:hypothetical protein n=1 Tax=Peribacillus sp. YIM B13477 TaxID=3366300 RepID=UPI00366EE255